MELLITENVAIDGSANTTHPTNSSTKNDDFDSSSSLEYQASVAIWKYCPPVLLVLGGFGNVATIFVLRRSNWGQSTQHVFLTALAVVDLCLLYTGLLRQWLRYTFETDVRELHPASCKMHTWLVYSFGTSSAWLLSAVTVQRAMSVVWPHRIINLCSKKKSTISVVFVLLVSFALCSAFLFMMDLSDGNCNVSDKMQQVYVVWQWVDMFGASLLPSMVLLFCNAILAFTLHRSVRQASKLGGVRGDSSHTHSRRRMARSMTIMLMLLSVTFLLLTLPVCVYMLWDWYDEDSSEDGKTRMQLKLAWAVTNMLWYTNSAVNFLLYCVSGTRFRNAFVTWITCGHVNKDPMTQGYTHSQSHSVNAANMAAPPVEMSKF